MTYNRTHARSLLTADELQLFSASLRDRVNSLDDKQLNETIARTRRARDKYRDLAKRQNIGTAQRAGRRAAAHGANKRTEAKATVFAEALGRLEKRRDTLEERRTREARKRTLDRVTAARKANVPPNQVDNAAPSSEKDEAPGNFMSSSAQAERVQTLKGGPTNKAINAHRSSATRRAQARRDSR